MMFDVGVRENKQKAAYYRVHKRVLSKFVRDEQNKGFFVFSVIPLFPKDREYVESEYSKAGLSEEKMREVREQDEFDDPNVKV